MRSFEGTIRGRGVNKRSRDPPDPTILGNRSISARFPCEFSPPRGFQNFAANFLQRLGRDKREGNNRNRFLTIGRPRPERRGRLDSRRALIARGLRKVSPIPVSNEKERERERERESNQFYAVDYSPDRIRIVRFFLLLLFFSSLFRRHLLIFTRRASVTDRIGGQIIRGGIIPRKREDH